MADPRAEPEIRVGEAGCELFLIGLREDAVLRGVAPLSGGGGSCQSLTFPTYRVRQINGLII